VLVPAAVSRLARVQPVFDLLFTIALAGEAIGSGLGAYESIRWPDEASHFVIPLLSAPIVYQVLVGLGAVTPPDPRPRAYAGAGIVTGLGVLALGAVWELVEWGADGAFGTDYSQGYEDTLSDLLADAVAAVLGGVLVAGARLRQREAV
jgi:uncharacterized membrane protein YjdF